jgi:kynurenine formamidase
MKIIDITGIIEPGMWTFNPPVPKVEFDSIGSLDNDGWISHALKLSTITGTYLETGAHVFQNERTIDEVKPEELLRDAVVVQIAPKSGMEHVTRNELKPAMSKIRPGDALIINTGWYHKWNSKNFIHESPHFDEDAVELMLEKQISILCSDMVSYDDPRDPKMPLLRKIFAKGILILGTAVGLGEITKDRVKLIVLPLRLKGVSASPCRAIVIEE